MSTRRERSGRPVVGATVGAAISTILPGFLVGALSVQIRTEFGVDEAVYGWAMSSYFLAATFGSVLLGRLAQRIGPRRQIVTALLIVAAVDIGIAIVASGFPTFVVLLAIAGMSNAASQTAINLALTRSGVERLGLAMAIKQSGMPTASMMSGIAVPVIALTFGWRWAFVGASGVALCSAVAIHSVVAARVTVNAVRQRPATPAMTLTIAAVAGGFLSFAAGSLNAWVVESGVDAGLSKGAAGLGLSFGAGLGIVMRLGWGFRLDVLSTKPFRIGGWMAVIGSLGVVGLAIRSPITHVLATLVAFASGWVWPIFTNFGIVRANSASASAATGVSQTGVFLGLFAAPLTTGMIIQAAGYPTMWLMTAGAMLSGALILIAVSDRF